MSAPSSKKWIVRAAVRVLLVLPVVALALAGAELALRLSRSRSFVTYQPCMHRGSGEEFFRYRPGCSSTQETEHGTVHYHFNEDGLRDRPRATFRNGAIVTLGDSITLGMYLDENETIPRLLEQKLGSGFPVLNAGIHYASTSTESLLYWRVRKAVPVKAVIWLLNGTDTIDERFYRALAEEKDAKGVPLSFVSIGGTRPGLVERTYRFTRGKSYLVELIRQWLYYREYVELAKSVPADRGVLCEAIFRLAADLKSDRVPLLFVFTPVPAAGIERIWPGVSYRPEELAEMVSCAKSTGAPVVDLSRETPSPAWYVADALHSSPEGARWLAERMLPEVSALVKKLR